MDRARAAEALDGRAPEWHRGVGTVAGVVLAISVDWPRLAEIGAFFAYDGSFVFGSGLAIVPFLYGGIVQEHHWLNDRQFVDAVAVIGLSAYPLMKHA